MKGDRNIGIFQLLILSHFSKKATTEGFFLIVSYFWGEPRLIAFHVKNVANMCKIASQGKLDLSIVDSKGWRTAMKISYSF